MTYWPSLACATSSNGSPPLVRAYRSLLEETARVVQAAGITIADYPDLPMATYLSLSPEALAERLGTAAGREDSAGPEGFSSMAQDVAAGRPTEGEAVFGDLLPRAEALGGRRATDRAGQ